MQKNIVTYMKGKYYETLFFKTDFINLKIFKIKLTIKTIIQ